MKFKVIVAHDSGIYYDETHSFISQEDAIKFINAYVNIYKTAKQHVAAEADGGDSIGAGQSIIEAAGTPG